MRELKVLYDSFKDSGDLKALFPYLTGNWEKDKKEFKKEMKAPSKAFEEDNETI